MPRSFFILDASLLLLLVGSRFFFAANGLPVGAWFVFSSRSGGSGSAFCARTIRLDPMCNKLCGGCSRGRGVHWNVRDHSYLNTVTCAGHSFQEFCGMHLPLADVSDASDRLHLAIMHHGGPAAGTAELRHSMCSL